MKPILMFGSGLTPRFPSPPLDAADPERVITQEAGIRTSVGQTLRILALVGEDDLVAQGAPLACLRDTPEVQFVAPMAGRVARISLQPGRKLSEIVLFAEMGGDVVEHATKGATTDAALRGLMHAAGLWPWLRRRPFGGMPAASERPAAIIVMAVDTRPFAPDPRLALAGRQAAFARGLQALTLLTDGTVFVCQQRGAALFDETDRVKAVDTGARHPQGSAGLRVHALAPASIDTSVWDIHAEDVAALGDLLESGVLPLTRLVRIAGVGLRNSRLVHTQAGADLRELTQRATAPGVHMLLSGSPLDGHEAHWLAPRHRQVTVLPRPQKGRPPHWFKAALTQSALPKPVIPTAALTQAFGGALPAVAFVRALSAGDDELAMKLGVLSLLEEDLGLADYVLGGEAHLRELLRGMLDRIRTELAP